MLGLSIGGGVNRRPRDFLARSADHPNIRIAVLRRASGVERGLHKMFGPTEKDDMSPALKVLGIVAASVLTVLGITTAVGMWTLQAWPVPLAPTVYLACALLVVFLVFGGIWFVVTRRELSTGIGHDGTSAEERGLQRLVGLIGSVLIGVLALGVVASWNVAGVRAQFVSSRTTHRQLEQVLRDPSPQVRLAACEEIFRRGWVFRSQKPLIAGLDPQPAMAVTCLRNAREQGWAGVTSIANDLNDGWTASMMRSQGADAAAACELAPWSPVASELGEQAPEPRLLHCAMAAATPTVRQCCAQTIANRGKLLELLGAPTTFPVDAAKKVFGDLVQHSFKPLGLSTEQQSVAAQLKTDDEGVRRWIFDLGCHVIDPTTAQPEILAGMVPLIEAESCHLTTKEAAKYTKAAAWLRLCEHVSEDTSERPVQQQICAGLQVARNDEAIEVAGMHVHEATRAPFLQKNAKFIEQGIYAADRVGGGNAQDAQDRADYLSQSAIETFKLTSMTDSTCQQARVTATGGPPTVTLSTTTNCKRYRNDLTVGEYLGEYKREQDEHKAGIQDAFKSKYVKAALAKKGGNEALRRATKDYKEAMAMAKDAQK